MLSSLEVLSASLAQYFLIVVQSEIEKFCDSSSLSVCIYHGSDRVKEVPREVMGKYDVVLTTYQVIEHDFRKMVSPNKVKCPNCGNRFKVCETSSLYFFFDLFVIIATSHHLHQISSIIHDNRSTSFTFI